MSPKTVHPVGGPGQPGTARCAECGYRLEGLLEPTSSGTCPECGAGFNPFAPPHPWHPRQWLALLAGASLPTVVLLSVAWVLTSIDDERVGQAIGVVGPFWVFMLVYAALIWPALWTRLSAADRAGRERRRATLAAYAGAIVPILILVLALV